VVDLLTFRLIPGASDEEFLAADAAVQAEAYPNQPGFLRRTTARKPEDPAECAVVVLWHSLEDAEAADATVAAHPSVARFAELAEPGSFERRRFVTLS